MPITIQVPFKVLPKETPWNEVCAWAIEKFGLPNFERYKFGTTNEYMEFIFQDEYDALMFQLYCGHGKRVNHQSEEEAMAQWL